MSKGVRVQVPSSPQQFILHMGRPKLKIETVALEDQQTKLIAELDSETFEKYKRQAARKISQSQKIPGFRPGKAPYDLVLRMVGEEALTQEAIELMLDKVYPEALEEAGITPSGPGKLEEVVKMDPPTFAFVVPLPPSVELGDYQEMRKEYAPEEITDEQVDATIRRLQRSYATAEPVERAAEQGDLVSFKLSAKRIIPEEGEEETLVEESPYQLIAGEEDEEQAQAWPYEGFSAELVGMSADESKTVTYTFSEESPYEDLRGKEAAFTIVVENVKAMQLPELTDEFAQSMGEFETMDALRAAIRSQLEQNASQQYEQEYFDSLIDELAENATVKYPPHMLEEEIEQFIHRVEHNLEHDRLDLDTYLKMREMDRETFVESEVKPAADKRLVRSLVLEEFARRENIEVKNEEIQSIYYTALQQMQQSSDLKKLQSKNKQSSREMANSLAMNTVNNIFNRRMMSRLKAIATGQSDEEPESIFDMVESETAATVEDAETEAILHQAEENEGGLLEAAEEFAVGESGEASAIKTVEGAEEHQEAAEAELLDEEVPQDETSEDNTRAAADESEA